MKLMVKTRSGQWVLPASLLVLLLATLSCGYSGGEDPRKITTDDLPAMVISAEEASDALGAPLDGVQVIPDLGQEFEGIDAEKHGLLSGSMAIYRPSRQGDAAVLMTLALFETAEGASDARRDILEKLEQEAERFQTSHAKFDAEDIGDENQGIVSHGSPGEPWSTGVSLRSDNIIAFIWVVHNYEADLRHQAGNLAKRVTKKIEALRQG